MGDASLISEINKKEGVLPQTAQVAAQQGAYAARLFNRRYDSIFINVFKHAPRVNLRIIILLLWYH